MHRKYRTILDALLTVGVAGLSSVLANPSDARPTDQDASATEPVGVAQRLQDIRDAVSAFAPAADTADGVHASVADPDIQLAWWGNGNGRGWGNGGRGWGNGGGPRWGNGGWHNWRNGGVRWVNF
jgi:rSAM-associated Gly-rich repeat protein